MPNERAPNCIEPLRLRLKGYSAELCGHVMNAFDECPPDQLDDLRVEAFEMLDRIKEVVDRRFTQNAS